MTREEAIKFAEYAQIMADGKPDVQEFYKLAESALRQQETVAKCNDLFDEDGGEILNDETVTYRHQMTNADRINSMTIEEKADFLSSIAYGRETPWSEPFARRMCDSCPTVHGTYDSGIEDDFHECDFLDGKCPHGSSIAWWLQQPAEEDDHVV